MSRLRFIKGIMKLLIHQAMYASFFKLVYPRIDLHILDSFHTSRIKIQAKQQWDGILPVETNAASGNVNYIQLTADGCSFFAYICNSSKGTNSNLLTFSQVLTTDMRELDGFSGPKISKPDHWSNLANEWLQHACGNHVPFLTDEVLLF